MDCVSLDQPRAKPGERDPRFLTSVTDKVARKGVTHA